jgi:hypothetical protein
MMQGNPTLLAAFLAAGALLARQDIAVLRPEDLHTQSDATGPLTVSPSNMRGWSFVNDQQGVACADPAVCRLVAGPAGQPVGTGSAELATTSERDGTALVLQAYQGTRFDAITDLRYWTYRQSADAGNNLAIALQVNADFDLTDRSSGYQGRLVFEPYQGVGGTVLSGTWQEWDARSGMWWGTKSTVVRGGLSVTNPCVQATPCTWSKLLATFPNVGVHATYGAIVLKAGSGWSTFRGNVDALTISVNGAATTYDFELQDATEAFPSTFPAKIPRSLWDSLTMPGNVLVEAPSLTGKVIRDLLYVVFKESASLETRRAAIASVHGKVIGGSLLAFYAVRIPYALAVGVSASGPLLRAMSTLEQNPAVVHVTEEHLNQVLPK